MTNLLGCDGKGFSATISGHVCEGKIRVENGRVYLCQNHKNGDGCDNRYGFKYSWNIQKGSKSSMAANNVVNFQLGQLKILTIRETALLRAKECFKDDVDNIDAFINGFEIGIEWFKQQNNN
jgi:hypothetical protein